MFDHCNVEALLMHWLDRGMWKAGIAIAGILLLLVLMTWIQVSVAGAQEKEMKDRLDAQEKELKDRQNEREKRAEERFQAAVTGLGDVKEGAKIGAAILLRTFLRPDYKDFYTQTFDLAVANLRLRNVD